MSQRCLIMTENILFAIRHWLHTKTRSCLFHGAPSCFPALWCSTYRDAMCGETPASSSKLQRCHNCRRTWYLAPFLATESQTGSHFGPSHTETLPPFVLGEAVWRFTTETPCRPASLNAGPALSTHTPTAWPHCQSFDLHGANIESPRWVYSSRSVSIILLFKPKILILMVTGHRAPLACIFTAFHAPSWVTKAKYRYFNTWWL